MNRNREKFQDTFQHLQVSPECVEEVLHMTEQRKVKRFAAKKVVLLVAVFVMLVGSALSVNAATDGKLFRVIFSENGKRVEKNVELIEKKENGFIFRFTE